MIHGIDIRIWTWNTLLPCQQQKTSIYTCMQNTHVQNVPPLLRWKKRKKDSMIVVLRGNRGWILDSICWTDPRDEIRGRKGGSTVTGWWGRAKKGQGNSGTFYMGKRGSPDISTPAWKGRRGILCPVTPSGAPRLCSILSSWCPPTRWTKQNTI